MGWICVLGMAVLILLTVSAMASGEYKATDLADQINRMIEIESAGDPNCVGPVGERGLLQIREATWRDICTDLKVEWSYDLAYDPAHNIVAGSYYWQVMVPRYLKHFGLPDAPYLRLAAYNWGIGNLLSAYRGYGRQWFGHVPASVQRHCQRWSRAEPRNYVATYLDAIRNLTRKESHGKATTHHGSRLRP